MQGQRQRNRSVYQQTIALLWKNIILKWRMRMQSFQEWFSVLVLLLAFLLTTVSLYYEPDHEIPQAFLGQLDDPSFNYTVFRILYTPRTKMAMEIMEKVKTTSVMKGIRVEPVEDENAMEAAQKDEEDDEEIVGVVFQDNTSYRLRFSFPTVVSPSAYVEEIDHCYNYTADYCKNPKYWFQGFLSLQSSIDSALIELITNHSVWDEMKSIGGIRMRSSSLTPSETLANNLTFLATVLCFSPFLYFLSQNVSGEKRKLKEMMKTMGLRDTAFWLSWGLLYAVYVMILSCPLAFLLMSYYLTASTFPAIFFLLFLYGISCICFCFMVSSLLKKPRTTSFVVFLFMFTFGAISIVLLINLVPAALKWTLSVFCPFAFGAELSKIIHIQKYGGNFTLSSLMHEPCTYILVFDGALYMLLALYFDKVIPDKYGVPYPPFFFLKKSYWFKSRGSYTSTALTNEPSHGNIFSDNAELVPPEFDGKEAIRLNNIKKTYKARSVETEALRGLSLDIYEGQITAVLGCSGAGKTTLLNILSGLLKPSDGSATIFKYNISAREDMEHIREISAVCPQFNVQFEFLTLKENLRTFAKIKGIPNNDVENEVQKLVTLLDLDAIQDTQANRLSGGQKRKLSLGITFLGDPQVLLLDEPTAGLDPYSRHQVWALLNERKAGRVTLLTTQLMDEADILADRKAFISHGRLSCVGSSLFLKKKWGVGYHLRMHVNELHDPERTTSLVKQYIPAAKLSGQHENELSYTLPLENVDKFPDLFSDMDRQKELGIVNYGVTMTTLEDVFLKLEGNEMIDEKEGPKGAGEMEQDLLLLSDTGKATIRGSELWRQQVCAIARMQFLNLKRESKLWGTLLLLFGIILAPIVIQVMLYALWGSLHCAELHPGLYFEPGKESFRGSAGLLILNDTGASIDNFIQAVKNQNVLVEVVSGKNVSDQLVHNGAIKVALEDKKYRFTLMCHMEVTNCFPVLVNIISNARLRMLNSAAHIRIWSHIFLFQFSSKQLWTFFSNLCLFGVIVYPTFPAHFAMMSIRYYKIKTRSQLRISGLFPSAFWCGLALVDVPLHLIILLLLLWPWLRLLDIVGPHGHTITIFCLVSFLFGYSTSMVLFLYVIAFVFRNKWHTSSFWSFILILVNVLAMIIGILGHSHYAHYLLTLILPLFPVTGFILAFTWSLTEWSYEEDASILIWVASVMPYFHILVLILLLRCLVAKYGRPVMRRDPVFRISPQRKGSHQNLEEASQGDDRDVQDERARVQSALASANQEERPVILVSNLRKEYRSEKACSCGKKTKTLGKVATKSVSFCVKKGEILGLLGPNGAGKSTTMNMITGDTDPTAGQVLMKGADAAATEENAVGFLGYCPQEDALWPSLTIKEHLEINAAVKGMQKDAAGVAISRIVHALELQGHLKTATKALPAGLRRKLCFALSMLGNPAVMLLDEPTAGMDPKGKRQVWKAILTALKEKEQGAILTTHHMEEAEAVCDRVAIMVTGQLRCLGSIQYLKSKFGKNYLLQIKVKGVDHGELLNTHILQIFPHAARQERISTLLAYKIPMEDALPLSKAFSMLEEAKRSFSFEEYSFSLNTLEQVFLELVKEQERDCFEPSLSTAFEWQQLQQAGV
ncbi:ATP-binding cassette sub-family A member 9-like [Lacerta agilis]|uniref:ATP-binding cassette sub-family A member 9-like n=1 Tax=Lacerta agilis TaxID=80427 RepID=UPI0014193B4B|nr:ATP-binding cassette sub-family A member 9-like [Lacerta agilis]XP_032994805.1 ATP-binding cassette sub-family A member 9-like [Lacerta agilis]